MSEVHLTGMCSFSTRAGAVKQCSLSLQAAHSFLQPPWLSKHFRLTLQSGSLLGKPVFNHLVHQGCRSARVEVVEVLQGIVTSDG